jgi:hypothetical protein
MANPTSAFGWQMPTSTDLVTDLPADFETFGQAVDTSLADLKGGTSGQVLSKNSNTDMDFVWVTSDDANAIQNTIMDAKGDLIGATAADTPARLAVGTNGQVLTADSTESTGIKWATPSSGAVTLISSTTFSNQASQAFDGVFSSTYKAYLVYFESIFGSANNNLRLQMRTAGPTTVTTGYFNGSISAQPNGSTLIISNNNGSFAEVSSNWGSNTTNSISAQLTFLGCSGASATTKVLYQTSSAYTGASSNGGFNIGSLATYTGFILTASAGNITGTVSIYGVA